MSARHVFKLSSDEARRALPGKVLIAQDETESLTHVLLKLLAYVLFYDERLQIEARLPTDHIPFEPDLILLDYELRPKLWIECGECSLNKLHKLAVKAPEAEIWVVKRSPAEAQKLLQQMERDEFRRGRYGLVGLDEAMLQEIVGLVGGRDTLHWFGGSIEAGQIQLEFNGLWFDSPLTVLRW
ncbi:MAG: YaeQ family protein [Limisphaerales bacterium]